MISRVICNIHERDFVFCGDIDNRVINRHIPKYEGVSIMATADSDKKALFEALGGMPSLPTPSTSDLNIILKLSYDNIEPGQVAAAILDEQKLVAKILEIIDPGSRKIRQPADAVKRAVELLGVLKVRRIVHNSFLMNIFDEEEKQEWDHAYTASLLMAFILEDQKIAVTADLPLVMLVHDIGKLVLRRFATVRYNLVRMRSEQEKTPLHALEESFFHATHAEIGNWLLGRWQLADETLKLVRYHHVEEPPPDLQRETILVQFVNWVDNMARGRFAAPPSEKLAKHVELEIADSQLWIDGQREFIKAIST